MQGWIKLHRQIRDCWIWQDEEPFDRRSAWVDLLLMANHADGKVMFNGRMVEVPAGSFITSETKLAARWKWSRKKVDGFLMGLESGHSLAHIKNSKSTMIFIENWGKYQELDTTEAPQKNIKSTSEEHQKHTNKNDKNDKNVSIPPIIPQLEQLHPEVQAVFTDYMADRKERKGPMTSRAITLNVNKLLAFSKDKDTQIAIIKQSIERGWKGLFEVKDERKPARRGQAVNHSQRVYSAEELEHIGVDLLEDV